MAPSRPFVDEAFAPQLPSAAAVAAAAAAAATAGKGTAARPAEPELVEVVRGHAWGAILRLLQPRLRVRPNRNLEVARVDPKTAGGQYFFGFFFAIGMLGVTLLNTKY